MKTGYPMIALALLATLASLGQAQAIPPFPPASALPNGEVDDGAVKTFPAAMLARGMSVSVVNGMLDVRFSPDFPDSATFGNIDVEIERQPDGKFINAIALKLEDGWQTNAPGNDNGVVQQQLDQISYSSNSIHITGTIPGTPNLQVALTQQMVRLGRATTQEFRPFVALQVAELGAGVRRVTFPSPGQNLQSTRAAAMAARIKYRANIMAASFEELRQNHPEEVTQYLLPILRDLQIDSVLQSDTFELMQVFPEAIDESTARHIRDLIAQLDADSAGDRDAAESTLATMGSPAIVILLKTDPATFSPEQAQRVAALCGSKKLLSDAEIAARKRDVTFLASCLQNSNRGVRAAALAALRQALGHDVDFDVDADAAGRAEAIRKLGILPASRPS